MATHILIVEDSTLVIDALRVLLEAHGHRVDTALSRGAALEALDADPPDVVLLDLTLPDGNGLDVALRAAQLPSPPRVFAMTGHDSAETIEACRKAGCVDVLVKPVPMRQLLEAVGGR